MRADALYNGPAGSHLGAGRILADGTLDRQTSSPQLNGQGPTSSMQYGSVMEPAPRDNNSSMTRVSKYPGLKADAHAANGGIGVGYSNVVLGGGVYPSIDGGNTSYKNSYGMGG